MKDCKTIIDESHKEYLLSLNSRQIKLIIRSNDLRKRFNKTLEKHDCKLIEVYKVIEK